MADDAPPIGPTRADSVRFGLLVLVLAVGGAWLLVAGLQEGGTAGALLVVLGGLVLLCVAALGIAVARVSRRDRRLPPQERAAARSARYAEGRERRPAWLESPGWRVLTGLLAAYWLYLLVTGVMAGVWRQVAVSGLFLVLSVLPEVQRRRRRASPGR